MKKLLLFLFVFSTIIFAQTGQRSVRDILDKSGRILPNSNGSYNARGYSLSYGKNKEPILKANPDGTEAVAWSPIIYNTVNGINGATFAVAISGNDVYVGGDFTTAGGLSANCIAKWNTSSSTWSALGPGLNGTVYCIGIYGSNVYAGGSFWSTSDGEIGVKNIAKWDGSAWSALGTGLQENLVNAVAIDGSGNVFAGGQFSMAGDVSVNNIAKWDGSAWSALGSGLGEGDNDYVNALQFVGTDLYAGGGFGYGPPFSCIAKWNGSTWSALGSGADNDVCALAVSGNDLYVGGYFTTAGGVPAIRIGKYNTLSSTWSPLGIGIGASKVNGITVLGSTVYAGGDFSTAGLVTVNKIAKWDGANWSSLGGVGTGSSDYVNQIAYSTNAGCMFVTGTFTQVNGSVTANYIATFEDPLPVELTSFVSTANGRQVNLNWETMNEINSCKYVIDRAAVNTKDKTTTWESIGTIPAAGSSNSPKKYSYADKNLQTGKYQYRLKMIDKDGSYKFSDIVETEIALPKNFELSQNYPNPFNPSTKIDYQVPVDAKVVMEVYNIAGQKVVDLVNQEQSAGYYTVDFGSSKLSSGVYVYRIVASDKVTGNVFSSIKKMMLLK
jgi:hypothetical protein